MCLGDGLTLSVCVICLFSYRLPTRTTWCSTSGGVLWKIQCRRSSAARLPFLFTPSVLTYSQVTDKDYMVFDEWWGPLHDTIPIHTKIIHLFTGHLRSLLSEGVVLPVVVCGVVLVVYLCVCVCDPVLFLQVTDKDYMVFEWWGPLQDTIPIHTKRVHFFTGHRQGLHGFRRLAGAITGHHFLFIPSLFTYSCVCVCVCLCDLLIFLPIYSVCDLLIFFPTHRSPTKTTWCLMNGGGPWKIPFLFTRCLFTPSVFTSSQVNDKDYMVFDDWWGPLQDTIFYSYQACSPIRVCVCVTCGSFYLFTVCVTCWYFFLPTGHRQRLHGVWWMVGALEGYHAGGPQPRGYHSYSHQAGSSIQRRFIIQRGHEHTRTGNWSQSGFQVTDKDYMVFDEWWGPLKDTMPAVLSREDNISIHTIPIHTKRVHLFAGHRQRLHGVRRITGHHSYSHHACSQVTDKDYMVFDEWWGPLKDTMPAVLSREAAAGRLRAYTANNKDQKWWLRDDYIYEESRANTSSIENMNSFNASKVKLYYIYMHMYICIYLYLYISIYISPTAKTRSGGCETTIFTRRVAQTRVRLRIWTRSMHRRWNYIIYICICIYIYIYIYVCISLSLYIYRQ